MIERRSSPLAALRDQPLLTLTVLAAAGVAWWFAARQMTGMDAGPGTDLGTLGWFTGVWAVMMAAMMLPSLVPTVADYAAVTHRPGADSALLFVCGYLLVWGAAGIAAYALFEVGKGVLSHELAWQRGGRWLAAGVLAIAAAYQLVPLKRECLAKCRTSFGVVRRGRPGGLALGVRSGVWCFGSSWALMGALFALGVMSLTWMELIAVLVALEKLGPSPRAGRIVSATILGALAVGIAVAPASVPGLVIPSSHGAMGTMTTMG